MAIGSGVLTDAQIRRMINRYSGKRGLPNIGPVGGQVPAFNTPQADALINRPVDPATGVQAPLNSGQIGTVLKELMRGSLSQYNLTERDIRRLYRGINRDLRTTSDPYLLDNIKGLLGQGLTMDQIMSDPSMMEYRQNLGQMRETGEQNMATDLAWVEKFRNINRDSFNALLLQNAMGVPTAAATGGGGGGGGGGGYRRYGRRGYGGGGDGKGPIGKEDLSVDTGREQDWYQPMVNQIVQGAAGIRTAKELNQYIDQVKQYFGTNDEALQAVISEWSKGVPNRRTETFYDPWRSSGAATGGANKYIDDYSQLLKDQRAATAGIKEEIEANKLGRETIENKYDPRYRRNSVQDQIDLFNKLSPKMQGTVTESIARGLGAVPGIMKGTGVDPVLAERVRLGLATDEEKEAVEASQAQQQELIKQAFGGQLTPGYVNLIDFVNQYGSPERIPEWMKNITTPREALLQQFAQRGRGKQRELGRSRIAQRDLIVKLALAEKIPLSANMGPVETHRGVDYSSSIDFSNYRDVPLSMLRRLGLAEGGGQAEAGASSIPIGPQYNARERRAAKIAARRIKDADVININNPARMARPTVPPYTPQNKPAPKVVTPAPAPTVAPMFTSRAGARAAQIEPVKNALSRVTDIFGGGNRPFYVPPKPITPSGPSSLLNPPNLMSERYEPPDYSDIVNPAIERIAQKAAEARAAKIARDAGYNAAQRQSVSGGLERAYSTGAESVQRADPNATVRQAVRRVRRALRSRDSGYSYRRGSSIYS